MEAVDILCEVRICLIQELNYLKWEFLKCALIPELPELPTLFWNCVMCKVKMLLIVGIPPV